MEKNNDKNIENKASLNVEEISALDNNSQKSLKQKKAQAQKSIKKETSSSSKTKPITEDKNALSSTNQKMKDKNAASDKNPKKEDEISSLDEKQKTEAKDVISNEKSYSEEAISSSNEKSYSEEAISSSNEKSKSENNESSPKEKQGKHTADSLEEIEALRGLTVLPSLEEENNSETLPHSEFAHPDDPYKELKRTEILGKHEQRMQQMKQEKEEKERKAKRNKIIAICIGAVAALYVLGAILFSFVTYPNTYLADNDLSFKTEGVLLNTLEQISDKYTLKVTGLGMNLEISGESIDYEFDAKNVKTKI